MNQNTITSKDLEIWADRWRSLNETMKALADRYEPTDQASFSKPGKPAPFDRRKTLHHLLKSLQQFAEKYFAYFYDDITEYLTLASDEQDSRKKFYDSYPPRHVLGVILDQIAHDLEIIQRAAEQRIAGSEAMKAALRRADRWAYKALEPVAWVDLDSTKNNSGQEQNQKSSDKKGPLVITYFHKSANIRVVPYAPVAVIGIPFTCVPFTFLFKVGLDSPTDPETGSPSEDFLQEFQKQCISLSEQVTIEQKTPDDHQWRMQDKKNKQNYIVRKRGEMLEVYSAHEKTVVRDYMALTHELGHYIFWHRKVRAGDSVEMNILDATYRGLFLKKIKGFRFTNLRILWYFRWIEEIVADVYGCLIAGPLIALAFQGLLLTASKEQSTKDDGEHPAPVVRPYIYTKVLEKRMKAWEQPENKAKWQQAWEFWFEKLSSLQLEAEASDSQKPIKIKLEKPILPEGNLSSIISFFWTLLNCWGIKLEIAKAQVWDIVDTVYDVLEGNSIGPIWWEKSASSDEIAGDAKELFEKFGESLKDEDSSENDETESKLQAITFNWDAWKSQVPQRPRSRLKELLEELEAEFPSLGARLKRVLKQIFGFWRKPGPTPIIMPEEPSLEQMLHAGGWTTKGPNGVWHVQ